METTVSKALVVRSGNKVLEVGLDKQDQVLSVNQL